MDMNYQKVKFNSKFPIIVGMDKRTINNENFKSEIYGAAF
jgi:hypothetical protein